MIYALTYLIEAESQQKAIALRDRLAAAIADDEGVSLDSWGLAQQETTYTVSGVDTKTNKPFQTTVEAEDAEDAAKACSKGTKVVAHVQQT